MKRINDRLAQLTPERLRGMRRGIEKESLRALPDGALALTPHPAALGSALTHPHITTDFSESQLELITGVHADVEACLEELTRGPPVRLPCAARGRRRDAVGGQHAVRPAGRRDHPDRPLRHVERRPRQERLPHGPGRTATAGACRPSRASTTTGRCPSVGNDEYFALIRNFRRHVVPAAVPVRRVAGGVFELRRRPRRTSCKRWRRTPCTCRTRTSLRMGRLGYQSDAQAQLAVSYNSLEGYAASLQDALTRPYPAVRGDRHRATRAASTTSSPPACCRSRTSSTAPSAPSA